MDAIHQHKAFLCGHFTMSAIPSSEELGKLGWELFHLPDDIRVVEKRYFYPEFVDFCYTTDIDHNCARYIKHINEDMTITAKGNEMHLSIKEITLYVMPFNLALFSIHIEQETTNLDDCTLLLFNLRSIYDYNDTHKPFVDKAILPLMEVHQLMTGTKSDDFSVLVENGNKFRIFQIINSHDESLLSMSQNDRDNLLYELATVSKITKPGEVDEYSASESYLQKVIKQSKISVFRNWSGLALMDTFTIHAYGASQWLVDNWADNYFRMIYIHSLYQKIYLFNLNIRFRKTLGQSVPTWKSKLQSINIKPTDVGQLVDEYESFEQQCCFNKISYNFLPLEIARAIDKGLEIKEERFQLFKVMEKEQNRKEEANDRRVNMLLFCLSLLALFSAIWDISCLLDNMYPYKDYMGSEHLGYRTVALMLLAFVSIVFIAIYRRKK